MSLQQVALCNLTVSLIISGIDELNCDAIKSAVLKLRIAGGHINDCGRVKVFDSIDLAANSAGSGYFVNERSDLMRGTDKVGLLLSAMRLHESDNENEPDAPKESHSELALKATKERGNSWIFPSNLGFLAITDFSKTDGARGGFDHAYAEPLVGLIQYVSSRILREKRRPISFWHYAKKGKAFVVTTA
ncbi:MAG: type I-F CRISPR-associated protein Csy2 [Gallionellaceae bacterium]